MKKCSIDTRNKNFLEKFLSRFWRLDSRGKTSREAKTQLFAREAKKISNPSNFAWLLIFIVQKSEEKIEELRSKRDAFGNFSASLNVFQCEIKAGLIDSTTDIPN